MRLLPNSATKTFPLPSTATPTGLLSCPFMLPALPHLVRNAPQVGVALGLNVAVGVPVGVGVADGVGVAVAEGGGVAVGVAVGIPRQSGGNATWSGRDSASMQSTLNSVTQSTHLRT